MNKKELIIAIFALVFVILIASLVLYLKSTKTKPPVLGIAPTSTQVVSSPVPTSTQETNPTEEPVVKVEYVNNEYGFVFSLPITWNHYSIILDKWSGQMIDSKEANKTLEGPKILIRHPEWTTENPRQDIPIMVFTPDQWALIQQEKLAVSAAPIGPTELGRNAKYVFALPARYNYAFITGYEEVEEILKNKPLN